MIKWSLPGRGYTFIRLTDGAKIGLEEVKRYIDSQYNDLDTMQLLDHLDVILDELHLQLNK